MPNIDPKTSEAVLSTALREIAHLAPQSAPPELGDSLMRAFRRHHRRRKVLRATSLYLAILAVSGGGLVWVRTQYSRTPKPIQSLPSTDTNSKLSGAREQAKSTDLHAAGIAVSPQSTQPRRMGVPLFARTGTVSSAGRSSSSRHPRAAPQTTTAQNTSAIQGLFVALPSFALCAPDEELRVIRVNMPISSLRLLGASVDEEAMTGRVTTDLLIGSDGTPYAVRLVM